jgi:hypothetical protein
MHNMQQIKPTMPLLLLTTQQIIDRLVRFDRRGSHQFVTPLRAQVGLSGEALSMQTRRRRALSANATIVPFLCQ